MKTIIITGVSSGLGEALFNILCLEPDFLICISRRFSSDQRKIAKSKINIKLVSCDLRNVNNLIVDTGLLGILPTKNVEKVIFINNAGVIDPIGSVGSLEDKSILNSINVNMAAPILIANSLFKMYKTLNVEIKILNISTGAAEHPIVGWSMYCATKTAAKMFFDVLKDQCINNLRVSIHNIDPGVLDTNMQKAIRDSNFDFPMRNYFINLKEEGKLKNPVEIAKRIYKDYIQK